MTPIRLYRITQDYTSATIFFGSPMTRQVRETIVVRPKRGIPRKERYDEIAKVMRNLEIPVPVFRPSRNHRPA